MAHEGMEEVSFKPIEGGWIFKLGSPLLFGRSSYFCVNTAQKAAIAAQLRQNRVIRAAVIIPLLLLAVPGASLLPLPKLTPWQGLLLVIPCAYILAVAGELCERRRVRPLVQGLPRAAGKITLGDQFWNVAKYTSFSLLSLLFAIFLADLVVAMLYAGHRSILEHGFGVLLYGLAMIYWAALIAAKLVGRHKDR